MRIALGMFAHEANSFSPHPTDLDDFEGRQLLRGAELLAGWEGTNTEPGGALALLTAEPDCEIVPLLGARALSGAPIRRKVFESLLGELLDRLRASLPVDGVLLVLHGAMMADAGEGKEPLDDATGEVLARVRELIGPQVPIVGTLDLHANVTQRMVAAATALVGYQTAPHVDMGATGEAAARLLLATLRGEVSPVSALVRLPMILPPENADHRVGPLAEVLDRAREIEARPEILRVGVYPVQPWLDAPDVASSVLVIGNDNVRLVNELAHELARAFWERRDRFAPDLLSPDEAIARALAREQGTVVLCDSADSTTSGSTGDSTAILRAALARAPLAWPALLNIVDPAAVAAAIAAGVGNSLSVPVGGSLASDFFAPVPFSGRVKLLSDGEFRFKGPGMRGVLHYMGRTAVLVNDNIYLVVMERAVSQWDPQLYRSLGLEPTDARIVQVKSPRAFRAAYEEIADEVLVVRAPGAASPELAALPWRRLGRPIYPLDPQISWP
ncbi:MAG: M81 family metallopeptidase [Chloroflexi bacterium]|nr:M81 family metallopeptidase [Chloroflexota bacterium]